jgi:hypothetical protein
MLRPDPFISWTPFSLFFQILDISAPGLASKSRAEKHRAFKFGFNPEVNSSLSMFLYGSNHYH